MKRPYNHTLLSVYETEKVTLNAHHRRFSAVILSTYTYFGKCPYYCYILGVGEIVLACGAPITLTQMVSLILAGSFFTESG